MGEATNALGVEAPDTLDEVRQRGTLAGMLRILSAGHPAPGPPSAARRADHHERSR